MQEYTLKVHTQEKGMRLDMYILQSCQKHKLSLSRTYIQGLIHQGMVTLNDSTLKSNYRIKEGDIIKLRLEEKKPFGLVAENIPLDIVYEDNDVIVLNKPVGIVVHPAAGNYEHTLVNALLYHTKELSDINPLRPGIVHRLDKDTSGLMVIAKNNNSYLSLVKQFSRHSVKRKYVAVVKGRVEFDEGTIDLPIGRHSYTRKKMAVTFASGAKTAKTYYRTLKRSPLYSLLELIPYTGRTHQLRVHLASLNHPICGDRKYGKVDKFSRLSLHAYYIRFIHPTKNEFMEFSTDIPEDFLRLFT